MTIPSLMVDQNPTHAPTVSRNSDGLAELGCYGRLSASNGGKGPETTMNSTMNNTTLWVSTTGVACWKSKVYHEQRLLDTLHSYFIAYPTAQSPKGRLIQGLYINQYMVTVPSFLPWCKHLMILISWAKTSWSLRIFRWQMLWYHKFHRR